MRRFAVFALAAVVAACGLSVVGEEASPVTTPDVEGGITLLPDGSVTPPDSAPITGQDANVTPAGDATVPELDSGLTHQPGCTVLFDDTFLPATLDPRWHMTTGVKHINGEVQLTQEGDDNAKGGLWWTEKIAFGTTLQIVFHYRQLRTSGQIGAGIGIAWVPKNDNWDIGDLGKSVGLCNSGLDGVGAALLVKNPYRLDAVQKIKTGGCTTNTGNSAGTVELGSGSLTLTVTPSHITATANTHNDDADLTVSTTGFVGFTAATTSAGSGESLYAVTEAKVTSCF